MTTQHHTPFRIPALTLVLAVSACGSGSQSGNETTTPHRAASVPPSSAITAPERPWAELSFDERRRHMAERVVPTMAPLFEAFDAERYANFGCATCHGPNAREQGYRMPSQLPALWPTGTPEQQRMVREHQREARFMFTKVLPTMTRLLGQPAWDDAQRSGFSCFNCHAQGQTDPGATTSTETP